MSETKESFVPKILADYHQNNRTGILTLKQKSVNKTIHFENGVVVFATTNVESEQLGTRLLEWGLLTPEELLATDKLAKENRRFGKSLVDLGYFQDNELPELFYRQTTRIMFSTFDWKNFDFRFTRCALPEYEVKSSIAVPQALLEGMRYLEDVDLIKESLGNLNKALKLNLPLTHFHSIFTLNRSEISVLSYLENKIFTPANLLVTKNLETETVIKTLCVLSLLGMLSVSKEQEIIAASLTSQMNDLLVEKQKPVEVSQPSYRMPTNIGPINEPVQNPNMYPEANSTAANKATSSPTNIPNNQDLAHRKLMEFCYEIENKVRAINRGASVYEVLEVDTNASLEQIKASYQTLSTRFHLERQKELLAHSSNSDFTDNLNYISTVIKQAYEILMARPIAPKPNQNTQHQSSSRPSGQMPILPSNSTSNQIPLTTPRPIIPSTSPAFSVLPTSPVTQTKPISPQTTPASTPKLLNQQEVMELCYLIENKLNMIRGESTHYQVLEIERSASRENIDQAYQQLMLTFDVKKKESLSAYGLNMGIQLEEISKAVRLASEVLRDPQKKQLYDERIGKALRRNTGQYSTLGQPDLKQNTGTPQGRLETKYPSAPQYSSQDSRHGVLQNKPVPNSVMPPLTIDSKMGQQQGASVPNPTSSNNYSAQNLSNTSAGQKIPTEGFSHSTQIPQNSHPYGQRNIQDDLNRSSAGNKIPINPASISTPLVNKPSGNFDLNRSNPGTKPSITIDPTRNSLPTFTPAVASKANLAQPAQPIQPSQLAQPSQPVQTKANNLPLAKAPTPAPHSELPQANKPIPGGKGKTFTATEHYLRSIELCDQEKYTEAIESLLMALKLSPKDGEYWAQLGRAYSNIDGYEKDTVAAYQKANEYSPREVGYLLELGDFLRKHGHRQKAAEVYSGVLNIRPQNIRAQTALAELVKESKEDEEEDTKSRSFWSKWLKHS